MKITKHVLKDLVKECLVEILAEGLGKKKSNITSKRRARRHSTPRSPAPDLVQFNENIDKAVGTITTDPLMASIFADTARTTLQEQLGSEGPIRGPHAGGLISGAGEEKIGDPSEIFTESAGNWAKLAFTDSKSR